MLIQQRTLMRTSSLLTMVFLQDGVGVAAHSVETGHHELTNQLRIIHADELVEIVQVVLPARARR
jgi:hypothetical protein